MGFSLVRLARLLPPSGLATFAFIGCASFGEGRNAEPTPATLDGGDDAPAPDASSIDADPLPVADAAPRVDGGCEKVFEEQFTTAFQAPWVPVQSGGGAITYAPTGGRDGGGSSRCSHRAPVRTTRRSRGATRARFRDLQC